MQKRQEETREKIGLLGGTFDPVHNGHLAIARAAICQAGLSSVIFIPAGDPPHKAKTGAGAAQRLEMVRLATKGDPRFLVSDYEVEKAGPSYSVDTVRHFKAQHGGAELYFIMGDDAYSDIATWHDAKTLLGLCRFLVFSRKNLPVPPPAEKIEITPIAISSTQIREGLKQKEKQNLSALLPEGVYAYILANHLYGR